MGYSINFIPSLSVKDTLFHLGKLYSSSPAAVCIRNENHDILYANASFINLTDFFQKENSTSRTDLIDYDIEIFLSRLELECLSMGDGAALNKSFSWRDAKFQIRMECRYSDKGDAILLWMINHINMKPLADKKISPHRGYIIDDEFDNLLFSISDKSLITLSFYMVGYGVSEISRVLSLEQKTTESRLQHAKKKIKEIYPSFLDFKNECLKNKTIYYFIDFVIEFNDVN